MNQSDMQTLVNRINSFANGKALRVAANTAKQQEQDSTSIGRDYKADTFAPYKKSTIYDRKRRGYETSVVNLTRTGSLKSSRFFDQSTKELRYGSAKEKIAEYLQGGTPNMAPREFVGVFGDTDINEISENVSVAMNAEFS